MIKQVHRAEFTSAKGDVTGVYADTIDGFGMPGSKQGEVFFEHAKKEGTNRAGRKSCAQVAP